MSNDRLNQFRQSYENQVCDIFMKVSFGSSGAPTLSNPASGSSYNQGVTSIVRNSTGRYTITLKSNFSRLMELRHVIVNATAPAAPGLFVVSDNSAASPATIVVQFNAAGTAADPASGEIALLQISLKNSSV